MTRRARSNNSRRRPAPSARLALLNLESRLTPAITVLNANDSGAGSLRQAILDTNANPGPDTIDFDATFFATPQTINLAATSGELLITDDLIITGPGAAKLTINGGGATRIFDVDGSAATLNVTISAMTVTGGNGSVGNGSGATDGGGIRTTDENLTLQNMVITANTCGANDGGGVTATSTALITVNNCTVSGNTAGGSGGGIYFFSGGGLLLENSTISGNTAGSTFAGGGGVYFWGTVDYGFTIQNSTIAGNSAPTASGGGVVLRNFNGTALIQNSTITGNTAGTNSVGYGYGGGGVSINSGGSSSVLTVQSSIISGNHASAANGNSDLSTISASTTNVYNSAIGSPNGFTLSGSSSGNLAYGAALNLLGLANYGGPTATIALGAGSLAVDAGLNYAGTSFDQRGPGYPRQVGAGVDIGAFEGTLDVPTAAVSGLVNVNVAGTNNPYTFQVTYSGATPINTGTLDNNDIRITGPNGFNVLATRGTFSGPSTAVVVNYSFVPPVNSAAGWDGSDNGTYTVSMEPNQVSNTNNGFAPAGALGTFQALIGQNYVVTNLNDSGAGSLRQAILDANSLTTPDTISFQAGLTGTISLTSGELLISQPVTITGPGAAAITIDAGGTSRIFDVNNTGAVINVSISGLTVTGGNGSTGGPSPVAADGGGINTTDENLTLDGMVITGNTTTGFNDGGGIDATTVANIVIRNSTISGNTTGGAGGGIYFFSGGSLLLENSTVSGNSSGDTIGGGGIYFFGTVGSQGLTIRNSTIAGNTAAANGGGIVLRAFNGTALIQNSTITGNSAGSASTSYGYGGGGIATNTGSASSIVTLESTIVSGNTSPNGNNDVASIAAGTVNAYYSAIGTPTGFTLSGSSANNLAYGAALNLQPLGPNGGPTQTIALGAGSLALDAGYNPASLTTDQRGPGFVRVSGPHADIGAFEKQTATAPTVTGISVNAGATQRSRVTRLDVTFSTQVTFAGPVGNAFTLVRNGGGSVSFNATANIIGGVTVVTLDGFTGGLTDFSSLADGRYTLTVLANQISAGGVNMASNVTFNDTQGLFRMYGDVNGDQNVNGLDLGFFRNSFGSALGDANYLSYLDFNGDTNINGFDLGQFRTRFGTTLP